MKPLPHNATPELRQLAENMRANPTPAEAALWAKLRCRQLQGLKFRQQHIALGYILDFYCPEYRLAIELDGRGHDAERDAKRDLLFAVWHVMVLRFPNTKPADEILVATQAAIRGLQIHMIEQAAHATAALKAMERDAAWYAARRTQLQRQKMELLKPARQISLEMPSSPKKLAETEAETLTFKGIDIGKRQA